MGNESADASCTAWFADFAPGRRSDDDLRSRAANELYTTFSRQRRVMIDVLVRRYGYGLDDAIHAAQRLLDRIIFAAFCEDCSLLPQARTHQGVRRDFPRMFQSIRQTPNHPAASRSLFSYDPLVDELKFDGEPWTQAFQILGGYHFGNEEAIGVAVLGHLFEQSVAELEQLRFAGGNGTRNDTRDSPVMPTSALRKWLGIHYTPPAFARLVVAASLGRLIDERLSAQDTAQGWLAALRCLRVVDPACGAGAFLLAAYARLETAYEALLHRLRAEGSTDEAARIELEYPQWIVADNLFGVDVSAESVEMTQLALWLRSARKGQSPADLSRNIVCRNSLIGDADVHPRAMDWATAFPHVFAAGGFDCVIGNPPWERLKLQEREFFARSLPAIASAVSATQRRRLIARVEFENPELWQSYNAARAAAERTLAYVRGCGRFPHTGRGDVNTYMLFAELSRQLVKPEGLIGLLVPSGIATDDTTRHFFNDLMDKHALAALYDFENKEGVFADVHRSFKFCVLLLNGSHRQTPDADFVFFARSIEDLQTRDRHIKLSARDLKLLNPNTRTCPVFRTRRDAELTKRIYHNVPILVDDSRKSGGNPWGVRFLRMFDQTNNADLFHSARQLIDAGFRLDGNRWVRRKEVYLPLYEAKMVQAFDHRAAGVRVAENNWMRQGQTEDATLVDHQNPEFVVQPRFWVHDQEVARVLEDKGAAFPAFIGFKDITSPTNHRTMIASAIPFAAVTNHFPLMLTGMAWRRQLCLLGNLNSFAFDCLTRQKIGGVTLNFFIVEQLPALPPDAYDEKCPWHKRTSLERWISDRVLKLACTANDMIPLAEAAGFEERVHKWDEAERHQLRAELDAAYFLLYGFSREEMDYVLGQFQGIVREDAASGGAGPTRAAITRAYDELSSG